MARPVRGDDSPSVCSTALPQIYTLKATRYTGSLYNDLGGCKKVTGFDQDDVWELDAKVDIASFAESTIVTDP